LSGRQKNHTSQARSLKIYKFPKSLVKRRAGTCVERGLDSELGAHLPASSDSRADFKAHVMLQFELNLGCRFGEDPSRSARQDVIRLAAFLVTEEQAADRQRSHPGEATT
jgi:hypothetical protein